MEKPLFLLIGIKQKKQYKLKSLFKISVITRLFNDLVNSIK